jgi:glucokinase
LDAVIKSSDLTIGIDIGGTKISAGVVDSSGNIIDSSRISTPAEGGKELILAVINLIKELKEKHEIKGIGISIAALISSDYGTIVGAPNIANLSKLNFVNEIKAEFKLPIVVENDANSAMWAEFKFGNAKGLNPVMFFIIGTGVGGGLVIDGKLFKGANGIGAEFGHMCVVSNGLLCGCGSKGCIEQYASGGALIRYANEVILNNPQRSETLLSFGEGKVLALAAFNKQADWLGLACASYSSIIDPEAIIIGGGVADAGELFLAPVREAMRKYMPFAESHASPKIIAAKFGNDAGLIGAADLVRV